MATERELSPRDTALSAAPELRLLDRRAFVGFPPLTVVPGLTISDFALQIPEISFPFNFTGGAARFQKKRMAFGFLEVTVGAELVARRISEAATRVGDLEDLRLHFRPGYIEGQARLGVGERAPVTFKIAFDGDGDRLALYVYDVRLYSFATTPAPAVAVLLANAARDLEILPEVEPRAASGFSARILPSLVELAAVGRGYKMPALDQARLSAAEVTGSGLWLRFACGGLPPPSHPDEDLLLTLEGTRAFADAEGLLAQGKLAEAREAYLRHGEAAEAHPFAVERLLTLLVADPQAHELALDVAATLARRRERSPAALWAEAVVREHRGEPARAAERYLALCSHARRHREDASAFFAAESAARAARENAPQMAVKALHEVLGLKPDHLPSLKALARAADHAQDRAGAIRAWRRIAALARDPAEAADAHVHMARLCALTEDDLAGARLHCEAALRLTPNHPDALYQLAELCHRAGEHLRAIKSLDRLREVSLGRHEVDRMGRAAVLAGRVWEEGLKQAENALLRYREAISLLPDEPEPLYLAARAAEKLGQMQEAISGYQQAIELAGPAPRDEQTRRAAHASHHAMAGLYRTRLGEPARAREHLEAALALDARDLQAIEELLPYFRAAGKTAELADALEKAAAVVTDPLRRAALWAEAGELFRGRLLRPEHAEQLLTAAVEADPKNRVALEGMLALAESRRDGPVLCRCLRALIDVEADPVARLGHLRRLAVAARDLAFDLDLAAEALSEVLRLEQDDLPALGELCALQRRRADMNGLVVALEKRARVAENRGDKRLAAAALRELSQVLEARLGRSAEALVALEKAALHSPEQAVLLELADLAMRCERPQNARRALEQLLSALPPNATPDRLAEVCARLGRACDHLGDLDAAKQHYADAFPYRRLDDELAARLEALYEECGDLLPLAELWGARAQAFVSADRPAEAAPLFLKSARALLRAGEKNAAGLRLEAALELESEGPLASEALDLLAELELERGRTRAAARVIARRAAITSDPRGAARLYFRAAQLSQGQDREEEYLARALEREPGFAPARIRRAELIFNLDPQAAFDDFQAVLALTDVDPDAPGEPERLELTRKAAAAAVHAGSTESARRMLALYAAKCPDDLLAHLELADLHCQAGDREALCDLYSGLWQRLPGPERGQALHAYAELCLDLGRAGPAADALRALLADDPHNLWAGARLWRLLPEDGADDERLALSTLLLTDAEGEARAEILRRRARIHRAKGSLEVARDDLKAALEHATDAELFRELAEICRAAADGSDELDAWRTAARRLPELASAAGERVLAIGREALQDEQLPLAREAFAAALALPLGDDDRCSAGFGLAEAERARDVGAAADALLEASKQGPAARRVEALLRRAGILEQVHDLDGAATSYGEALELAPTSQDARSGLRRTLSALGRHQELAHVIAGEAQQLSGTAAASVFAELGELLLDKLGQIGPAEAALRRAAELDEGNAEVRRRLAHVLASRGAWAEAADAVEQFADLVPTPEAAPVLRAVGGVAHDACAGEVALRLLRRAHALVPDAPGDWVAKLAQLLEDIGAAREALPLVRRLADAADFLQDAATAEAAWLRLADLSAGTGEETLATEALRRILQERPGCRAAAERLSELLRARDPRESIEVLWRWAGTQEGSPETNALLERLAARVREELADVALAASILHRLAEVGEEPLAARRALVALYREAGHTDEQMAELAQVANLCHSAGDVPGAIEAWGEQAKLAQGGGRVEDALATLERLREICQANGDAARAAEYEVRRAELFRDAKLDLRSAEEALTRAFELAPSLEIARRGEDLARFRDDAAAQAAWLERGLPLHGDLQDRARAHLALAILSEGALADPATAELQARQALALDPTLPEAQQALRRALERDGRVAELAAFYEELAAQAPTDADRARHFLEAARIWHDQAGRPDEAVGAVLAARAVQPGDLELTARCADLLNEAGRTSEAAEFDAVLLEADPLRPGIFQRHAAHLKGEGEWSDLAALMLKRAERQRGADAAHSYLEAAAAFRQAQAPEQALLCEDRAFDAAPEHDPAWEAVRLRGGASRRVAEILRRRADAVAPERVERLRDRADLLLGAGEQLLAAEAFDDLLSVAARDPQALRMRADLAAASGGALAAQPFDRRLLSVGGDALPAEVRIRAHLRLGHAALGSGAYHDAAEALEAVADLDPSGEKGREALSLLAEVYARTQSAAGQYRASLALARRSDGEEAEALYRRAAELFADPKDAVDALLALAKLHPSERRIVDRAAEGLRALGRNGDAVDLYERGAEASGGSQAAEWLTLAAQVTDSELSHSERAQALRQRAVRADPRHLPALRPLAEALRRRSDPGLVETLAQLADALPDDDERASIQLERARLLSATGDVQGALPPLREIVARGSAGAGYGEALELLIQHLRKSGDPSGLGRALEARAALTSAAEKARFLLEAARAFNDARDLERAVTACRHAVSARPTVEALEFLAALHEQRGEPFRAARALIYAAELAPKSRRRQIRLSAIDVLDRSGEGEEAAAILERLADEHPDLIEPAALSARLLKWGVGDRAALRVFGPAMAEGRFEDALAAAESAGDAARVQEALWALCENRPDEGAVLKLWTALRGRPEEQLRLAGVVARAGRPARSLYDELLESASGEVLEAALEQSIALRGDGGLAALANTVSDETRAELVERLLDRARVEARRGATEGLHALASRLSSRRLPLLRELIELHRDAGRPDAAGEVLQELLTAVDDPSARAALDVELAELYHRRLRREADARDALEHALLEDPESSAALTHLAELLAETGEHQKFVAVCERLSSVAGEEALGPFRVRLAGAYDALGRDSDAFRILAGLEETPERLQRRAELADALGLAAESLQLREKLALVPAELEPILLGYARAGLASAALRLGERLLAAGELSPGARREVAERLSSMPDGASLAAQLWPEILRASPLEAEAWTLFGISLRQSGREEAARLASGFGLALVAATGPAPAAAVRPLARSEAFPPHGAPAGLYEITSESMPRLHAALAQTLGALDAGPVRCFLHATGGVEAWLRSEDELILGAGALGVFGPVEIGWLCALALALGRTGAALVRPGAEPALLDAALAAFDANPASLAAGRVLAFLDGTVRGWDPSSVDVVAVLRASEVFRAIALHALELV